MPSRAFGPVEPQKDFLIGSLELDGEARLTVLAESYEPLLHPLSESLTEADVEAWREGLGRLGLALLPA